MLVLCNLPAGGWPQRLADEAARLLAETVTLAEETQGPESAEAFWANVDLIMFLRNQQPFEESARIAEQFRARLIETFGSTHHWTRGSQGLLAQAYTGLRRYAEAKSLLLDLLNNSEGRPSDLLIGAFIDLYTAWGKTTEAESWRRKRAEAHTAGGP